MASLTVSSGGVPVGSYQATFSGVEPTPENREKGYGAGLRWIFQIQTGPQAGQVASRITRLSPSPQNACGKMLAGILGRALQLGEQVDPEQHVGRRFLIVVAASQNGSTRIEAVAPVAG